MCGVLILDNVKIILNEYKYIQAYATIGGLGDRQVSINGVSFDVLDEFYNYQYIDNELIFNPIPKEIPEGVNVVYDGSKFIDLGNTQDKQDFWKKKMIETNNQIKELREIGLGGGSEESSLRVKLEEYKKQYMNAVQEEAIEIDRGMA